MIFVNENFKIVNTNEMLGIIEFYDIKMKYEFVESCSCEI